MSGNYRHSRMPEESANSNRHTNRGGQTTTIDYIRGLGGVTSLN